MVICILLSNEAHLQMRSGSSDLKSPSHLSLVHLRDLRFLCPSSLSHSGLLIICYDHDGHELLFYFYSLLSGSTLFQFTIVLYSLSPYCLLPTSYLGGTETHIIETNDSHPAPCCCCPIATYFYQNIPIINIQLYLQIQNSLRVYNL